MYGLPEETNLNPLLGKELIQLGMGAHQFSLNFSDGKTSANISVESAWKLHADNGKMLDFSRDKSDRAEEAAWLTRLIGQSIVKAEAIDAGTLRILFSNGWSIDIIDDSAHYESYQISFDNRLIIV